jgi:outer membrane protein OmpA-like peptidoglycan-associated protein
MPIDRSKAIACLLATIAAALVFGSPLPGWHLGQVALADETGTEIIIHSLKRRKTRGLGSNANTRHIRSLIEKRRTRGLSLTERDELYDATAELEQIDLPVYFALGSAEISASSKRTLDTLGEALTSIDLEGDQFIVGGHTDRRGSRDYNQRLSEERAKAVKRYLLRHFRIEPEALVAVGYGFDKPKKPDDPLAGENRRVQLVNIGAIN